MTYLGNEEILKNHKIAFFCSQKCPTEVILKSFDWAIEQRNKGNCVITGAHSSVEKDVFYFLLKGKQPLILVLDKWKIFGELDPMIKDSMDHKRLLIITPESKSQSRVSVSSSFKRNEYIVKIANEVVIAHASEGGNLNLMLNSLNKKRISFLDSNNLRTGCR